MHLLRAWTWLLQGVLGPSSPVPTQCLLLKNMFDPAECGVDPASHLPCLQNIRCTSSSACMAAPASLHVYAACSRCLPAIGRETEPNWPEEIAGDVKEECGKYGMVSHLHVDKDSKVLPCVVTLCVTTCCRGQICPALHTCCSCNLVFWHTPGGLLMGSGFHCDQIVPPHLLQGFVYVKFATITAAEAAQKALHGRWFAGKQICAEFQLQAMYRQHFGE